jgi:hypothetical protein
LQHRQLHALDVDLDQVAAPQAQAVDRDHVDALALLVFTEREAAEICVLPIVDKRHQHLAGLGADGLVEAGNVRQAV